MMLLPLTQCLRVDQLRASFQKHVGTTVPLKAAQVALNLARVFSTIKNKIKIFAGLTGPIFFKKNLAKFCTILLVTTEGYSNPVAEQSGCCHVGICIRHHTDTGKVHRECLVSCNDHGLAVRLPCNVNATFVCLFVA
jgi:hypothetical protein